MSFWVRSCESVSAEEEEGLFLAREDMLVVEKLTV